MNVIARLLLCLLLPAVALPSVSPRLLEGLPLAFEPNRGQTGARARFLARAPGQTVFVTRCEVVMLFHNGSSPGQLRLRFPGSRAEFHIEPEDLLPGYTNYLRGSDPAGWRTRVPTYARLRVRNLYPGVDVVFHGHRGQLEFDFVIAPGADPSEIRLRYRDSPPAEIDDAGDLVLKTTAGAVRQHRPVAYQEVGGDRRRVPAEYVVTDSGEIAFHLGEYRAGRELVIDPVISFSTFLGGSGLEEAWGIAVDQQGYVYVAGTTQSPDFPSTPEAKEPDYQSGQFPGDAFITKLSPDGGSLVYSTFLGGNNGDIARDIAVDAQGNVYVAGETESIDFPTTFGAYQTSRSLSGIYPEGFVTKLKTGGSDFEYSTYLGDDYSDRIYGIAIDTEGNAYVAGASDSSHFPITPGAYQGSCAGFGFGGFVSKLNADGSNLDYSTRLCGSGNDEALDIAVDAHGNAYVAGVTGSEDFPTTGGALQITGGGDEDGFLTKVAPDGQALVYSTYVGGSASDWATGVGVDSQGIAYVVGRTRSTDMLTTVGAFEPSHSDGGIFDDAFVMALNTATPALVYSTHLGGSRADRVNDIAVTPGGAVVVTGFTESPDFPVTPVACQTGYSGGRDVFLARLDSGGGFGYSFYLGGRGNDRGLAVAVGPGGAAYVAGQTASANFPTTQDAFRTAYEQGYAGATDAFVAKLESGPAPQPPCVALNGLVSAASFLPGPVAPGQIVSLFGAGLGPGAPAVFDLNGGDIIAKELAGARVLFDGVPAPMIFAGTGQINTIVPYSVDGRESTTVKVEYQGVTTAEFELPVTPSAPAIFTLDSSGGGPGAILNQDSSVNTPDNRAEKSSIVQIFATGEGQTSPGGVDGRVAIGTLPKPVLLVTVTIGGMDAPVKYQGAAPGLVAGVIQINAEVPRDVASGSAVPIVIKIGSTSSPPGVTLAIQ